MTEPSPSLEELAERVRRLEDLLDGQHSRPISAPDDADPFWILDGLEQRHGRQVVAYAGSTSVDDAPVRWQMTYDSSQLIELDWTMLASALGALGHPARLQILQLVARREATTAADLANTPSLGSTGQIYHHLRQLVAAGWLRATTKGRHEIPPERLVPLLVILAAATA